MHPDHAEILGRIKIYVSSMRKYTLCNGGTSPRDYPCTRFVTGGDVPPVTIREVHFLGRKILSPNFARGTKTCKNFLDLCRGQKLVKFSQICGGQKLVVDFLR